MTQRVYNFSAGPAMLPLPVLEQAQRELPALPDVGMSVLEISHRSKTYGRINESAQANLRRLLDAPDNYKILFLQGGARLQFSMVPINLMGDSGRAADYVLTGSWGNKAMGEAQKEGPVRIAWDGKETGYDRVPTAGEVDIGRQAPYVHITSNETIQGVQFPSAIDTGGAPLVADASSDFLCRPLKIEQYGLVYACAQKNVGPAGVTVVVVREDLLDRCDDAAPGYLSYRNHAAADSCFNTPCTFGVYMVDLVARWLLEEVGGLEKMEAINSEKARMLYEVIDASGGFYAGHAEPESRSMMNVTFRLPTDELQDRFLKGAETHSLFTLKGHRSVGGVRASIYNAMPVSGVETLRDFMRDFLEKHGN